VSTTEADPAFENLLQYVRETRGFDYTLYKRPSLMRRFKKRMDAVGAASFEEYGNVLREDGAEFGGLFNTILINVTKFFRDPEAWEFAQSEVIPRILEYRTGLSTIRAWSAGCASGEEAFTTAILLCEALGDDAFRDRVKLYATDIDEHALAEGRRAVFKEKELEGMPEEIVRKYFHHLDGDYMIRSDIRRAVIFGRNDLLQDAPISRVDLLVSRNTLMYFEPAAQERVLANFAFALDPRGFLMVGKAEALQTRTSLFEPVDVKNRFFVKRVGLESARIVPPLVVQHRDDDEQSSLIDDVLKDSSFEQSGLGQLIVDRAGNVIAVNQALRMLFGLKLQDVGRPLQDLELSYRPVDLRSLIDEAQRDNHSVSLKDVEWARPGEKPRRLDLQVTPLVERSGQVGVLISYADVSRFRELADELARARRELETASEELQSTVEELETTNEELQSTNEELETTNEELQSTNEELETINEELQSTNEELETMNEELRERTDEALEINSFTSSILWSIEEAIVVVDRELRVSTWSRAARELWGLAEEEVAGDYFLNLDIGVPVVELREPIRRVLSSEDQQPVSLEGHDRRGRPVRCEVSLSQLRTHLGEVTGVILVMEASRFDQDDTRKG
jgi:two-component system CheB/CheR fusion protein